MPSIKFQFSVEGKTQFDRAFDRLDLAISDLTPIWGEIKSEFFIIEREQFASEGGAGLSGKWKPLSPKYEEIKSKKFPNKTILRATDKMWKSLTSETENTVYQADKDSMAIGTKVKYAKYHQNGGGKLPQREVISFSKNQRDRLQKRIQKALLKEMRKTRLLA